MYHCAQRRPGLKPRLHKPGEELARGRRIRSTKAGAETPATPRDQARDELGRFAAQRRPGLKPRLHTRMETNRDMTFYRSTKAGAETPATRLRELAAWHYSPSLNEGRG